MYSDNTVSVAILANYCHFHQCLPELRDAFLDTHPYPRIHNFARIKLLYAFATGNKLEQHTDCPCGHTASILGYLSDLVWNIPFQPYGFTSLLHCKRSLYFTIILNFVMNQY